MTKSKTGLRVNPLLRVVYIDRKTDDRLIDEANSKKTSVTKLISKYLTAGMKLANKNQV